MEYTIQEERQYIGFLKETDLGSQYPKERFEGRVEKLGMEKTDDLMIYDKAEWAGFAVT